MRATCDDSICVDPSACTLGSAVDIAVAGHDVCALTVDSRVLCWGARTEGRLTEIDGFSSELVEIAAGWGHVCALTGSGGVECWGDNDEGQLGIGSQIVVDSPLPVDNLPEAVTAITALAKHTCALLGSGRVYCSIVDVGIGSAHTCVVLAAGSAQCWGHGRVGQLGNDSWQDSVAPVDVNGADFARISVGAYHTCGIKRDASVTCWGDNIYGTLGNGTGARQGAPGGGVGLPAGVVAVSSAAYSTCAVLQDGQIFCWGQNEQGQHAVGLPQMVSPQLIPGISGSMKDITVGTEHVCALSDAGNVSCWGSAPALGSAAGLGSSGAPVAVSGLPQNVDSLAAGSYHTCASAADQSLWCWGANSEGQLGDGTTVTQRPSAVQVTGLGGLVTSFGAGWGHTCAAFNDGFTCD